MHVLCLICWLVNWKRRWKGSCRLASTLLQAVPIGKMVVACYSNPTGQAHVASTSCTSSLGLQQKTRTTSLQDTSHTEIHTFASTSDNARSTGGLARHRRALLGDKETSLPSKSDMRIFGQTHLKAGSPARKPGPEKTILHLTHDTERFAQERLV